MTQGGIEILCPYRDKNVKAKAYDSGERRGGEGAGEPCFKNLDERRARFGLHIE